MVLRRYGLAVSIVCATVASGCAEYWKHLQEQSAQNAAAEKQARAPMDHEFQKDDGYAAVDMFAFGAPSAGKRVKFCTQPWDIQDPSYTGPAADRREPLAKLTSEGKLPRDRYVVFLSTSADLEQYVSIPISERDAFRENLAAGDICMWMDGTVDEVPRPAHVNSGKRWVHVPLSRWDGVKRPHANSGLSPASAGSVAP